jgi:hypothetical protein
MHGSIARVTRGAALAASLVCAAGSAALAADNSAPADSIYDKFLKTIGLKGEPNDLNYGERSPLVVPPTRELPPPTSGAPPAAANWPTDPDLTQQTRERVQEAAGPHPDYAVELARPLRPSELTVANGTGSRNAATPGGPTGGVSAADYPERTDTKHNFFNFDWFKKEQYVTFTGEPARSKLTDPPPGYLTPSPDHRYGLGPAEEKAYTPPTVADRVTPTR